MRQAEFTNPFRPGAGHLPPYLAGRTRELEEMEGLLGQKIILNNLVLTGLRGVGKTVLLETFKPTALRHGWLWCGNDLSESASISEETLATRIIADVSLVTAALVVRETVQLELGFARTDRVIRQPLNYDILRNHYENAPGLVSDKLKSMLEFVWAMMPQGAISGIVFAYDEAQNLSDHAKNGEFPLSVLLDVFQSLQRKSIPFMLILTGLPTLQSKLVEARTYSERMFHFIFLTGLTQADARDAIVKPITDNGSPVRFSEESITAVIGLSAGYPFFIQFICKEVFDIWINKIGQGEIPSVPAKEIVQKLDSDFFQGRWARVTDRQRELLRVISMLPNADSEFTVQEAVQSSRDTLQKPFTASHVSQMLASLSEAGLVYKNRHGKHSLAVPLLAKFIQRQTQASINWPSSSP